MAAISTLVDDFTTQDNTKWTFPAGTSVTGGQVSVPASVGYPNISSNASYDLTGSSCYLQLVAALSGSGASTFCELRQSANAANYLGWSVLGGQLTAYCGVGGTETVISTVGTFNASTHKFLRIRHAATTITWDWSTDGTTWTSAGTWTPTFAITALTVNIGAGYTGTGSGTALWDNVNTTGGPVAKSASDSATGAETLSYSSTTASSDTATGAESATVLRASSVADSATGAEAAALQRASSVTDSATGSESLDVTTIEYKSVTDSATGNEGAPSILDATFLDLSDAATGTEVLSSSSTTTAADGASGSESLAVARSSQAGDSATGAESLAVQQQFVAVDAATGTEVITLAPSVSADDVATGSENLAVARSSATVDGATGAEVLVVLQASSVVDSATGSEGFALLRSSSGLTDSATGSENIAILRISVFSDSATGSEAPPAAGPFVVDSAIGVEDFQIVVIPFTQVLPLKLGVIYDLVVVARVPQQSGPPQFFEIDPIEWKTLAITNTLSEPQELSATAQLSSLTEPVIQRLRDPDTLATELRLYRNGKIAFAGPLLGWQTSGETLTIKAQGILAYVKMMVIATDQKFVNVDQFTIVKAMIDQWQNGPYGDFGINTASVAGSGVVRSGDYLRDELHNVFTRVAELGNLDNGFDIEIDPATRQLQLWNPKKGVDRSTGADAIVFDNRNVTSSDIVCSVAVGDLASEGYATAKPSGADSVLFSTKVNTELRAKYGRVAVTQTYSDVSQQNILDGYTQGLIDARNNAFIIPGPKVRVTPDADLPDYAEGDTVSYELGGRLSVSGAFRIRKRVVNVGSNGRENVDLEFV